MSHLSWTLDAGRWTLDAIGTIATSAADLALALSALTGPDAVDPASLEVKLTSRALPVLGNITPGIPDLGGTVLEPEVQTTFTALCDGLTAGGARLVPTAFDTWNPSALRRAGLLLAEAEAGHLLGGTMDAHPDGFSQTFCDLVGCGRTVATAILMAAQRHVYRVGAAVLAALSGVDALLMPTAAHPAVRHDAPVPARQPLCFWRTRASIQSLATICGPLAWGLPSMRRWCGTGQHRA